MAISSMDKQLLINQAARLTTLGVTVEQWRCKLKHLVENGVPYSNPRMLHAYQQFVQTDSEWKRLEAEHLLLRKKLGLDL